MRESNLNEILLFAFKYVIDLYLSEIRMHSWFENALEQSYKAICLYLSIGSYSSSFWSVGSTVF